MLTKKDILDMIRQDDFDGDPFGTTMHWWFAIAETLHFDHGYETVPAHWEYNPGSATGKEPDNFACEMIVGAEADDLIAAGNILCRYRQRLGHQGRDY